MAISSRYTRGIEIQIGGNTTKLKTALDTANRAIRTTQSELDTLKNSLKLEWDVTKFQRAQELAQKALSETEAKAEVLRKALAAMGDPSTFSTTQKEQYEALRRELSYVEVAAQKAQKQLDEVNKSAEQARVDELTGQLEDADAALETTGARLDAVRAKLEHKWDAKQFDAAQQLAQQAVTQTEAKAELLRQKLAALDAMGTEKTSAEYQKLEKQLIETESAAERARSELQSINQLQLNRLNQSLEDASQRLSRMGTALTAGVTAPLTAAGVAAVKFSSDTEESMNKVEVAFGSAADRVKDWSASTLNSIGLAQGTALDMAALFGDMATSMGYGREEAAQMSIALVNLAADLSSFKNIGIDQVSTALKSIFTGETESLKELGVVMTQANLDAYALAQGYTTAYTAMDQAQQVAVRYQYVLANTQNAQGDFARTSDSTANQLRILQESLKEAAATAGGELLPIITPIIARLNELIQTFGDLDEGTQKAVVQAGLFLAALGPMLKVTSGITTAVKAGITVYQTLRTVMAANTTATAAATAAQTGLNAAMAANPVGMLVTAIGTLVAVLGSFVVSAALTAEQTDTLTSSINKARRAYADTRAEIQENQVSTLSMVDALARLTEEEHKTAAEKAAILELVEQLNDAVPNLSLAYDAQSDSLNLTAEAIRNLAEAEYARQEQEAAVERLSTAYREQITIANELEAAEDALQEARERYASFDGVETKTAQEEAALNAAKGELIRCQGEYDDLSEAQEQNAAEIARLEQEYGQYNATAGETSQLLEETGSAADTAANRLASLNGVLSATQGAFELLSQAQKEQSETGYLSLDTVVKLLGEYPQLSGYLIEAANGYQLADGALQNYINTQRAEYALALSDAQKAADAIVQAETDKINAIGATTATAKEQLLALSQLYQSMGANSDNLAEGVSYYAKANEYREAAQAIIDSTEALANFDRISASLFRENSGGGRGSTSSSSSAGRGKTQAELELEAYQEAVAELEHQRAMEQISEEMYYQEKAALGDQYLAHNKEARQELDEELYEWQKGAYERDLTELEDALEAESITWQEYLEGLQQARMEHLDEGSEEYAQALRTEQEETQRLKEEAYDQELADQQYFLDMGLISEEDFYARMAELRDQYLAEDSEAWRQANVQIRQYQQERQTSVFDAFLAEIERAQQKYQELADKAEERYNEKVQELEDSLDASKDALKDWYDAQREAAKDALEAKKDQIDQELELEKDRLNAIIEGIDAEIQARKELREDEKQDDAIAKARKRLEAAQAQLAFARTEEDRIEWEKEVIRLQEALDQAIQDKEDTLFYREKEDEKEQVKEQIEAAEDAADKAKEEAEKEYEAQLDKLEAEYEAELARLEAEHQAALEQAKKEYQEDLSNAASSSAVGQPAEKKEEEEIDPEILDIARKEDVDLGVAKDMWEANQRYKDEPGYVPYGSRSSSSASSGLVKAASSMARAVETAARSISGAVNQITKNNSASITYNTSGGMTEGQVARTVRKVLDELDR